MRYLFLLYGDGEMSPGAPLCGAESSTTVRLRGGRMLTSDGPFRVETTALGGYYVADCADLDEALERAAQLPAASSGVVEIRPVRVADQFGGE